MPGTVRDENFTEKYLFRMEENILDQIDKKIYDLQVPGTVCDENFTTKVAKIFSYVGVTENF